MVSSSTTKPKRTVTKSTKGIAEDNFYGGDYKVTQQDSLSKFDGTANSNKFYVLELHTNGVDYRVFANYGRVGAEGRKEARPFSNQQDAEKEFNKIIKAKLKSGYTRPDIAVLGRGSSVARDNVVKSVKVQDKTVTKQEIQASKTDSRILEFIKHIYAESNQAVSLSMTGSVKSDVRGPLGMLGLNGINKGRMILDYILNALKANDSNAVMRYNEEYYRNIPRKLPRDVRKDTSWVIDTVNKIAKEMETLDLYEGALKLLPLMDGGSSLDKMYAGLNAQLRPIDAQSEEWGYIGHKINTTHASNHHYKLRVKSAFEVNQLNAPQFDPTAGNIVKLFHGTRSANMVGILSSNIKMPKTLSSNIPRAGAMFGDGLYFASDCTKSANYSFGTWVGRANKYPTAFLFICEVALGNVHKVNSGYPFREAPMGYHSVMGCKGTNLYNNEFIVYKENQVRIKYVVEVEKA